MQAAKPYGRKALRMNLGAENEHVEHKKSTGELREGVQSVASILNKHGAGELYFGVRDDGEVVGQQMGERTLRDVSQAISNSIEPPVYANVEEMCTDSGKSYVKVSFCGNERPYSCKGSYRIRVADEDLPMSTAQLESLMLERLNRRKPWDTRASQRPISDVNEKELRDFIKRGQEGNRIKFAYTTVDSALASLNLLIDGKLTNAAAVLFCPSLDVQLKMGMFVDHERIDVLDMQQERGTLFQLVDMAERYITANIRRRFIVTGERTRKEVPEIPQKVIREALMNAFAHRDWSRSGYVQIDIYADAVDIISPGWFIESQDPYAHLNGESSSSDTRNKLIAATLFRSGDIESSGLGMRMIRKLCDEAGVGVTYERISFGTKLTLRRVDPYAETIGGNRRQSAAIGGNRRQSAAIEGAREALIALVAERGSISRADASEALGLKPSRTRQMLSELVKEGKLAKTGESRAVRYHLAE